MVTGDGSDVTMRTAMLELSTRFSADTPALASTLAGVTSAAVALMPGVDYADVMLVDGDTVRTLTPTSGLLNDLDAAQLRLGEGPCLRAAFTDLVVRSPDLPTDPRWPDFAAIAVATGIGAMMSFQLYTHPGGSGALNLFSCQPSGIDPAGEATGAMLATHAAVALIAAQRHIQFESALGSRDLIGQAKGVVMERFAVDATHAFELLRKLSQDSNTPVRTVAAQIVDSRRSTPPKQGTVL